MSRTENRERLLRFLETICRPDRRIEEIHQSENLVRSGLIDSLALLEIIAFLETEFGVNFSTTGIDPVQLGTIPNILDLIEQQTA